MIDWEAYRACPTCRALIGAPCRSRSGAVVDGRPDEVEVTLESPHVRRARRSGRLWQR